MLLSHSITIVSWLGPVRLAPSRKLRGRGPASLPRPPRRVACPSRPGSALQQHTRTRNQHWHRSQRRSQELKGVAGLLHRVPPQLRTVAGLYRHDRHFSGGICRHSREYLGRYFAICLPFSVARFIKVKGCLGLQSEMISSISNSDHAASTHRYILTYCCPSNTIRPHIK